MGRGIDSRNRVLNWVAKLHRLAGRYDNPMPTWFLVPIGGLKLPSMRHDHYCTDICIYVRVFSTKIHFKGRSRKISSICYLVLVHAGPCFFMTDSIWGMCCNVSQTTRFLFLTKFCNILVCIPELVFPASSPLVSLPFKCQFQLWKPRKAPSNYFMKRKIEHWSQLSF